jgi:dsRNA-specific ribonuclease
VSYDVINNYEKLELLGDSIVEIFIEIFLYKIFAPLIYENDNYIAKKLNLESQAKKFNNYTVTKIKSFLCSNNFMCKLSYIWTLPLYFKYSGEKIKKNYEKFLQKENIQKILNRKFTEYENSSSEFPKFIADIFEALIGGIYIDSNLENCFQLLHNMYIPYLLYCIYHFDEIKLSAVNDFSDLCGEIKQMPHFYSSQIEDGYIVKAYINDKLFFEGKGLSPSEAKQNAAQLGIKKIKESLKMKE